FADKLFLATILCLMGTGAWAQAVIEGNYNVTAFCSAVPVGTSLGSIVSCDYYYVCGSSGPTNTSCQTGYAYNYTQQTCQPASQANCYYGLANPCAGKTGEAWVPATGACNQYHYCYDGEDWGIGSCDKGQKFDAVSSQCVWSASCNPESITVLETDEPTLNNLCSVMPPSIYFGDTLNCSVWNYCNGNELETGNCLSTSPYMNAQTGVCGYNSNGNVCQRVTGDSLGTASTSCSEGTQPDPNVCGQYQQCIKGQWTTTSCSYGTYFNVSTSTCVSRLSATPVAGCNRCQYATETFVNAVDSNSCSGYYYCKNGQATAANCTSGLYFNEQEQGCVSDASLASYVQNNGACRGATASSVTTTTVSTSSTS
ncbi:hypothetical protein KR018_000904, partial [Drosophila ironensis]